VLILIVFAFAGLSPFRAPKNGVTWIRAEDGLRFSGDSVVISEQLFATPSQLAEGCSVELWFQSSNNTGSSTMLDFYQAQLKHQFTIRQIGNSLIQVATTDTTGVRMVDWDHTFFPGERTLVTVTSGVGGTTLYMDAVAVAAAPHFRIQSSDCSGQLLLGEGAVSYNDWNGDVFGVAVCVCTLSEQTVRDDFAAWRSGRRTDLGDEAVALFTFGERSGAIAHNDVPGQPALIIPATFQVQGHPFLEKPRADLGNGIDWKDLAINVVGFVPFGFFLSASIASARWAGWSWVASFLGGALVSLTIEVLQWYLPTRDSSLTDVVTNVVGTMCGTAAYRFLVWAERAEPGLV
jgi:hypothetical protein